MCSQVLRKSLSGPSQSVAKRANRPWCHIVFIQLSRLPLVRCGVVRVVVHGVEVAHPDHGEDAGPERDRQLEIGQAIALVHVLPQLRCSRLGHRDAPFRTDRAWRGDDSAPASSAPQRYDREEGNDAWHCPLCTRSSIARANWRRSFSAASDEIEETRRVPYELDAKIEAAGLYQLYLPEAYGGPQADPRSAATAIEEISMADGSTGWVCMIGSVLSRRFAWMHPDAVHEMQAMTGSLRAAGSNRALGRAHGATATATASTGAGTSRAASSTPAGCSAPAC